MFDKKHIPNLYKQLNKLGYLNINEHFVWMSEMEWMPYEEVINYEYEEGITQEVLPFAFTGGGDKWVFIENGTTEPYIGRYYHPEVDGEYCARNLEGNSSAKRLSCYRMGQASHINCPIPSPVLFFYTFCTAECAELPELLLLKMPFCLILLNLHQIQ